MNGKLTSGYCSSGSNREDTRPMTATAAKAMSVVTGRRNAKSVCTMASVLAVAQRQRRGGGRRERLALDRIPDEFLAIEHGVQHRDHHQREESCHESSCYH